MKFSRQEYWGGLQFPSPGDLPDPGSEPSSLTLQADSLPDRPQGKPFHSLNESNSILLYFISLVAQRAKRLLAVRETRVWSLGQEDPLEKEIATHSSTLAWKIPWTDKPGRLQSMGSQRVGHDWATSLSLSILFRPFRIQLMTGFKFHWTLSFNSRNMRSGEGDIFEMF